MYKNFIVYLYRFMVDFVGIRQYNKDTIKQGGKTKMTAVFRDEISSFMLENVENIQWDGSNGTWSVMFKNYDVREVKAQLVEINQD